MLLESSSLKITNTQKVLLAIIVPSNESRYSTTRPTHNETTPTKQQPAWQVKINKITFEDDVCNSGPAYLSGKLLPFPSF